jgi:hypothetical protein
MSVEKGGFQQNQGLRVDPSSVALLRRVARDPGHTSGDVDEAVAANHAGVPAQVGAARFYGLQPAHPGGDAGDC